MMIAATTAVATPFMGPLPSRNGAPKSCPRASHPCGPTRGPGNTAYLGWSAPSLADCGAGIGPSGDATSAPWAPSACAAAFASHSGSAGQAKARPRLTPGSETSSLLWCGSPALRRVPVVDVPADLILGQTVALLDLAFELIPATRDDVEIIVGELAPLLLHLPFDLLPISLHAIPVHFECTSNSSFAGKTRVLKKGSSARNFSSLHRFSGR